MAEDHIRYDILAQEALRGVMRKVLAEVARTGLPGNHHFFITFLTGAPGVRISTRLRERYPEQMTIVIQFQYWDLKVTDTGFEVGLSFSDVPERLEIPFSAVRGFYDPSVNFELEFDVKTERAAPVAAEAGAATKPRGRSGKARPSAPRRPKPKKKAEPAAKKPAGEPPSTLPKGAEWFRSTPSARSRPWPRSSISPGPQAQGARREGERPPKRTARCTAGRRPRSSAPAQARKSGAGLCRRPPARARPTATKP